MEILIIKTIILAYALIMTLAYINALVGFAGLILTNRNAKITSMTVYQPAIAWALFYFLSLLK